MSKFFSNAFVAPSVTVVPAVAAPTINFSLEPRENIEKPTLLNTEEDTQPIDSERTFIDLDTGPRKSLLSSRKPVCDHDVEKL